MKINEYLGEEEYMDMKINEYLGEEDWGALFIGSYEGGGRKQKSAVIHWCKDVPIPHWSLTVYAFGNFIEKHCINAFVSHEALAGLGVDQLDDAKEKANGILGVTKDINYGYQWRWRKGKEGGAYGVYCEIKK